MRRTVAVILAAVAAGALAETRASACTAFCATDKDGTVFVGNNEDYTNPRTKLRFIPATPSTAAARASYGRVYVGYDDLYPQGGMNERGLWFDGFSAPGLRPRLDLPSFSGSIVDEAMATCATVEEVVQLFSRYNRAFLSEGILMFADATGDAVSIEANAIVRKRGPHFVQTNFHQSRAESTPDGRFTVATAMLDQARGDISLDLFRRILAATHQEGGAPTLYSNVYDLRALKMYLYYFHDFERVVTIDLAQELKKGARMVDIPSLFPRNAAAEAFAAARPAPADFAPPIVMTAVLAAAAMLFLLAVIGWFRATRQVRVGSIAALAVAMAGVAALIVFVFPPRAAEERWLRFSIGPATGENTWFSGSQLRSNGMTLISAIATAYEVPTVRIVAPAWLRTTRYAINATVDVDDRSSFREYLKGELIERLHLVTHVEPRPFNVLILGSAGHPTLDAAPSGPNIHVGKDELRAGGATMEDVARGLQSVLGRPVIDETGITGTYNVQIDWGTDRLASVTSALRDRFGLTLTPAERRMDALVVDDISRDASLVLLEHAGRALRWTPASMRERLSQMLAVD
jgi:uncharacterized protein (TIGR03435 family)